MLTDQAALFKAEVVKILTSGQTDSYISNALGISENLIYRWRNNHQGTKKVANKPDELSLENQQVKEQVR